MMMDMIVMEMEKQIMNYIWFYMTKDNWPEEKVLKLLV